MVADDAATILTFTQRGLSVRNAHGFTPGTHAYLDRLDAFLDAVPLPAWGQRHGEVQGRYR